MGNFTNLNYSIFAGFDVFPRYPALSTQYKDSQRSGQCVPFYPCQRVGPEAVSIHMEAKECTQVHIWHQTVPVCDNTI